MVLFLRGEGIVGVEGRGVGVPALLRGVGVDALREYWDLACLSGDVVNGVTVQVFSVGINMRHLLFWSISVAMLARLRK